MKAIVYISRATVNFSSAALVELSSIASERNYLRGITGYLWFQKGQFIQYIEGEPDALNLLMSNIESDRRHEILYKAEELHLEEPRFPKWSMKYLQSKDMFEIGLEHILSEQLMSMRAAYRSYENLSNGVWRTVDSISKSNNERRVIGGKG